MTDFSLSSGSIVKAHKCPWGAFPTKSVQLSTGASSGVIVRGRLMVIEGDASTGHGLAKSANGPNAFYIAGFSEEAVPASLVSSNGVNSITISEANPFAEFSAVTKGANLSNSQVGQTHSLAWDSSLAIHYVDLTGSTATDHRVLVTGLLDSQGDSGGRVTFRFLQSIVGTIQGSSGSYNSTTPILAFYR